MTSNFFTMNEVVQCSTGSCNVSGSHDHANDMNYKPFPLFCIPGIIFILYLTMNTTGDVTGDKTSDVTGDKTSDMTGDKTNDMTGDTLTYTES